MISSSEQKRNARGRFFFCFSTQEAASSTSRVPPVGADDSVRPNSAKCCHSEPVRRLAWESVSPRLPLRGRCQREALTEGEMPRVFLSPSRLRRQPPPRGGLTARRCRADGTSYPKGICSAALHCRGAVPYTRFSTPSRRAGPVCPAEKCVPGGGTHGSRPTGAYPPKKQRGAPCGAPRVFRNQFTLTTTIPSSLSVAV